jgi:hypothetical protein
MKPDEDMTRFIRNLKGISKSVYLDEFISKEEDIAESVLDDLPEEGKVNSDVISKFRADETTKEDLKRTMTVVGSKVKVKETRDKPNQMVKKAIDALDSIDLEIIKRLTDEQIDDMKANLERLEEVFQEVKEAVNV